MAGRHLSELSLSDHCHPCLVWSRVLVSPFPLGDCTFHFPSSLRVGQWRTFGRGSWPLTPWWSRRLKRSGRSTSPSGSPSWMPLRRRSGGSKTSEPGRQEGPLPHSLQELGSLASGLWATTLPLLLHAPLWTQERAPEGRAASLVSKRGVSVCVSVSVGQVYYLKGLTWALFKLRVSNPRNRDA